MEKLSVVIIAKDEEKMIGEAIESVRGISHETMVVDTGSSDETVKIAKRMGARVVCIAGGGFSEWRDKGLKEARGEWVLYLDADERVGKKLGREIIHTLKRGEHGAYAIPRQNVILGRKFKHGGFWPDYVKRLYLKSAIKGWRGELHEEPIFEGELGHLRSSLLHIKHETFYEMMEKTNKWSDIEAKLMYQAGHPGMNVARFMSVMLREFWYRMIRKGAFLDGVEGVMFAMYQVYSRFVSYAKLWELQIKTK